MKGIDLPLVRTFCLLPYGCTRSAAALSVPVPAARDGADAKDQRTG